MAVSAPPSAPGTLGEALARGRSARRLAAVLACYLALTGAIGWRLVEIQVLSAGEYRALAARQAQRELILPARRGRIYDRAGEPLALSLAAAAVYANPEVVRDSGWPLEAAAARLSPLLGRSTAELAELLQRDATFVYLGRQLPRAVGDEIMALRLPGIGILQEPARHYPAGSLAAQLIGYAGIDNQGLSGLELQYDDLLAGVPGRLRLERAPGGVTITAAPREVQPAVAGTDVVLTIDRQIQHTVEQILAEAIERFQARGASAVVLDSATGDVLAMASAPAFSQAEIGSVEPFSRRNRAVTDVFEPGSVNKVIPAAAALEAGLVRPEEVLEVPYEYTGHNKTFRDLEERGTEHWTFAEVMANSSNVGTILTAERVGHEVLYAYMRRFGYGERTGVGFPGESAGLLPHVDRWSATSLPTIAIGHGVSATLLQVAGVFQTIATGGEWVQPRLLRGTVGPDGHLLSAEPPKRRRVISEETASALSAMLVGVVESGTGELAAVPGYPVAGKTGTAQKPSETSRGYAEGKYIATFAGFVPAHAPALVIAVMIDEPTPIYGGMTAAPVFSEITAFALQHRRVAPDGAPDRFIDEALDGERFVDDPRWTGDGWDGGVQAVGPLPLRSLSDVVPPAREVAAAPVS
jgi:cell division protein FtsI (penicillin-binding protein 3)